MSNINVIKDRKAIAAHGADAMARLCPGMSVDTLLTHPRLANQVAAVVCRKLAKPAGDANVHEVLRALLSSRKRGDLKTSRK